MLLYVRVFSSFGEAPLRRPSLSALLEKLDNKNGLNAVYLIQVLRKICNFTGNRDHINKK